MPSRFGLLTDQNPSRFKDQLLSGLMFMADEHKETGIQQGDTTIAETLRESRYDTALIGKRHLGHGGKDPLPTVLRVKSVFDGGLDYFEVGRQIKVAGSEEAMVPDMGMGGASFGYGNATFAITTATVPDAGSTAALLALSVVALAFARRRLG